MSHAKVITFEILFDMWQYKHWFMAKTLVDLIFVVIVFIVVILIGSFIVRQREGQENLQGLGVQKQRAPSQWVLGNTTPRPKELDSPIRCQVENRWNLLFKE